MQKLFLYQKTCFQYEIRKKKWSESGQYNQNGKKVEIVHVHDKETLNNQYN